MISTLGFARTAAMYAIGLTGGIGSGKSQVADHLQTLGAVVVDADRVSHALTAPGGAAIDALRDAFGAAAIAPDGALDRAWMRTQAFGDAAVRHRLEAILHPLIAQALCCAAAQARGPYCVFVIPLLVESGRWRERLERICVVDCEPETQVRRVQRRSGLTRQTIERIMTAQVSRDERLAAADDVIVNDAATDLETLHRRTNELHQLWRAMAARQATEHCNHE